MALDVLHHKTNLSFFYIIVIITGIRLVSDIRKGLFLRFPVEKHVNSATLV